MHEVIISNQYYGGTQKPSIPKVKKEAPEKKEDALKSEYGITA